MKIQKFERKKKERLGLVTNTQTQIFPRIKKPTSLLMRGTPSSKGGKLHISPDGVWVSNEHWIIRQDRLKSPARATREISTRSITNKQVLAVTNNAEKHCTIPCKITEKIEALSQSNEKLGDVLCLQSAQGTEIWVNALYALWLKDLGGDWYAGNNPLDPVRIEYMGETIAVLMPVRR